MTCIVTSKKQKEVQTMPLVPPVPRAGATGIEPAISGLTGVGDLITSAIQAEVIVRLFGRFW